MRLRGVVRHGPVNTSFLDIEEARIIAWFNTCLKNEAIRLVKKQKYLTSHEMLTLDAPLYLNTEDGFRTLLDSLVFDNDIRAEVENLIIIQDALSKLTLRQKKVIISTVINNVTEKDTANALGVSQPAVHKAKEQALDKLRKIFANNNMLIIGGY